MGIYVVSWGDGNVVAVDETGRVIDSSTPKAARQVKAALREPALVRVHIGPQDDDELLIEEGFETFERGSKGHVYAALSRFPDAHVSVDPVDEAMVIANGFIR